MNMQLELYKDKVRKIIHNANKEVKEYDFREKDKRFVCPTCRMYVANKMRSFLLKKIDRIKLFDK